MNRLKEACERFDAAVQGVVDAFNSRGEPCPASYALAAEKARAELVKEINEIEAAVRIVGRVR